MGKYHIVSVGISKHQELYVPNLEYAHKDAIDFFELVTSNVDELGCNVLLTNSEATLGKIQSALGSELQKQVKEDDFFFFFYSGHGTIASESKDGSFAHYILPYDATRDIQQSCIPVTFLKGIFDNLKCTACIVFLDSCFSGGINSKHFPNPRTKSLKGLKTFANTLAGKGSLVFTASKDDEEAIEDEKKRNGLFTSCLLEELQRERNTDKFSVVDTFTPIAEAVVKRAQEVYGVVQTPTFKGRLEGIVYLPTFKNRLPYTPDIIDLPLHPESTPQSILVPELELGDKKMKRVFDNTISFVNATNKGVNPIQERIVFESICSKLLKQLKDKWDVIFSEAGGNVGLIPEAVAKLEGESYQIQLLGSVLSVYGSEKQMEIYGKYISRILEWEKGRAGLVALISVPEAIVAEVITLVGMVSVANNNLKPFADLLRSEVVLDYNNPPQSLSSLESVFYCDGLGGNSTKVHDHMRELFKSYNWLCVLAPELDGTTDDFELQTNFLMVVHSVLNEGRLWADFARFYSSRVMPLVYKIKYDVSFQSQLASLLNVKKEEVRNTVLEAFRHIKNEWKGGGGYWWESIHENDLFTREELEAAEKQSNQN